MMMIKDWKLNEIASQMNGGFLESVDSIERETEKAYLLNITWAYNSDVHKVTKVWCPKSATMTEDEYEEENAAIRRKMESGLEYNKKLSDFAKANGLKVRERMTTATLLKKIEAAGLTAPARV